jgi:ligand-binding sensor domain-containing protein
MKAKVTITGCLSFRQGFLPVLHLALAVFIFSHEDHIRFDHISSVEGFSNVVYCIHQDHRGFMWFGTQEGLLRYDGYTFKQYKNNLKNPTSISNNMVLDIHQDKDGVMWIGTEIGGFCYFDRKKESFIRCRYRNERDANPGHDIDSIFVFYQDRNGVFWIGTWGGLIRFDPLKQTWSRFVHDPGNPDTLKNNGILALCEDYEGILWVGTEEGGLSRFEPKTGKFSNFFHQPDDLDSLSHNSVYSIFEDSKRNLWVGTFRGLEQFDHDSQKFIHYRCNPQKKESLCDNRVRVIFEDSQGRLWIGTEDGLSLMKSLSEKTFISYRSQPHNPHSLSYNFIPSLYKLF